jgi:hypothetical protein
MMKVVRMMVIIPHVMVEEPHKMAKALHILTEAPLEKTSHHLRQFWLSIVAGNFVKGGVIEDIDRSAGVYHDGHAV